MPDYTQLLATEPGWAWLVTQGWTIAPTPLKVGTARANPYSKRVEMKPAEYWRPSKRTLRYVLPHEIGHAVHYEVDGWECAQLCDTLNVDRLGGLEVIAERWCLERDRSPWMRTTVRASCIWHGRVKRGRYTYADVTSTEAGAIVARLQAEVATP